MTQENPSAFEQEMERINNSVITLKNPDSEDFTHTFGGIPYTIRAGETLPFAYRVGEILAKHLAMYMARKAAKKAGKLQGNDDKKAVNLYTETALRGYIDRIIVSTVEKPLPARRSEAQREKERTLELQKTFTAEKGDKPIIDKRQVVAELKRRKVNFNPRDTLENLLEKLKESEMQGGKS